MPCSLRRLLPVVLALAAASAPASGAPAPARPAPAPAASRVARDPSRDTLAWVGDRAITGLDLVRRIEWMPWAPKAGAGLDSAKVRALEALAAEALLARDTAQAAADSAAIAPAREGLRRALLRDALFRAVTDTVAAPAPERIEREVRRRWPHAGPAERAMLRRTVADSLRGLGIEGRAADFLIAHLAPRRVVVDSAVFLALADSLHDWMAAHPGQAAMGGGGTLVPGEAPDAMLAALAPLLARPLARLPDGPLTLRDALEDLRFYLFAIHARTRNGFRAEFNDRLRTLVEGELMAREAARRGMDARADVRSDLALWTDAWLARRRIERLAAGPPAGEDDAWQRLVIDAPARAAALAELDVEEILVGTRGEADAVRARLAAGAPFDSLARALGRREGWSERGGRSGWFPARAHPELAQVAMLAPAGALVGPGRLPEGWSVLRVLGRRLRGDSAECARAMADAREGAEQVVRAARVDRHVAALAGRTNVRLAPAALRRVEILPANMVTRRRLGFGGGMVAAPSLPPIWGWARLWREGHAPLP